MAEGRDYRLLDIGYMDMKASKFECNRDPLTPDISCDKYIGRVATDFELRFFEGIGYWNNYVHTEGVDTKVETVGWRYELGIRITPELSTFYEHHSRHRMDSSFPGDFDENGVPDRFPVEDSYGVRFHFYINPKPHRSLFK